MTVGTRLWDPTEAIPLMIRAGAMTGTLLFDPLDTQSCSWIPVDVLAAAVCEIAGLAGLQGESAVNGHIEMVGGMTNGTANGVASGDSNGYLKFTHDTTNGDKIGHPRPAASLQPTYNLVHPRPFPWSALLPLLRTAGLSFDIVSWSQWLRNLETGPQDPVPNPAIKLLRFWKGRGEDAERKGVKFATSAAQKVSPSLRDAEAVLSEQYIGEAVAAWKEEWEGKKGE